MKYLTDLNSDVVLVRGTKIYYNHKEAKLDSPTGEFISLGDLKALKYKLTVFLLDPHTKLDEKSLLAEIQNRVHMDYYELYNKAHDIKWMNRQLSEQLEKEVNARVQLLLENTRLQKIQTNLIIVTGALLTVMLYIVCRIFLAQ